MYDDWYPGFQEAPLTPREMDVARLISDGKSNQQIACELEISLRTVEKHSQIISSKLGFRNRVQVMLWFFGRYDLLTEGWRLVAKRRGLG